MPVPRRRAFPHAPFLPALVLLALAFLLPGSLRADIQNPPGRSGRGANRPGARNDPAATVATRPASAVSVPGVEVPPGGSVDIPLRAAGQLGKSIDFLLREPPAHGTLGEVRTTGRDSAVVTYTHRAEDGPATDSFAYAVQAPGTAVSAPAVVEVRVLDDPPRPALVGEEGGGRTDVDFGAVPAGGGTARREVWVENRGGGVAVGILEPPAPWVVEGAAGYRLGRDERQGFTLVFRPGAARAYTGRLVVGRGGSGGSAQLLGAGLRPDGSRPPPAGGAEETSAPGAVATLLPPRGESAGLPPGPGPARAGEASALPSVPASSLPPPGEGSPPAALAANPGGGTAGDRAYAPLLANTARPEETPVKHLTVQERGKHTLTVTWPVPKPAPTGYRVERRRLWLENGDLQMEWDPLENVAYTAEPDGTVHAVLRGLNADEPQTVRVLAVDGRGTLSAPSAQLISATLPDPRWWQRITPLRALFTGLGVCLLLLWRHKRVYG